MKKIVRSLSEHLRAEWNPVFFALFVGFVALSILYNYGYLGARPDWYFRRSADPVSMQLTWGALLYPVPYFAVALTYCAIYGKMDALRQPDFWLATALILFTLYANKYLTAYKWYASEVPLAARTFYRRLAFNFHTSFFFILAPTLFWYLRDKAHQPNFYGLTAKGFDWKPYALMLLVMLPLLCWASFQPSFLRKYPRYEPGVFEAYYHVSAYLTVPLFELIYAAKFTLLELFFRGFMVLALARFLGRGAVWPMVAVYVYIHFSKPLPETIGSFFGGYILGVIALSTRSVLGGVFIHMGVAMLMELLAFLQKAAN